MRAYNLFQHKCASRFVCAVAKGSAVPGFMGTAWEYVGSVGGAASLPAGFDPRAAAEGSRFHGFYLFQRSAPEGAA
jgi:hypothetical protein